MVESVEQEAITNKPTKPARKPKPLKVVPPEAEAPKAKPKAKAEAKQDPKPKVGGFRYQGSQAQQWDKILEKGGTWESMAKECGVSPGRLRAHGKHRTGRKSHTMVQDGDNVRLIPVNPA